MSKKQWFPVHAPDNGGITDYVIMEGDPINGTLVGHYNDMGAAHYYARLHNHFVSPIGLLNEVDAMFQSEIHFTIEGFWDGGINWEVLGGARGNGSTIEEALVAMVNAAKRLYPDSEFTKNRPYDVPLNVDLFEAEVPENDEN